MSRREFASLPASGRDRDDAGAALAVEDSDHDIQHRGRPALPRLGFGRAHENRRDEGIALALAAVATLALLGAAGLSTSLVAGWDGAASHAADHEHASERVAFIAPPEPLDDGDDAPEVGTSARVDTDESAPTRPSVPAVRDTLEGAGADEGSPQTTGEQREFPVGVRGRGVLPSPKSLGESIGTAGGTARARANCAAPCRGSGVVGYAPGTELERRDSILRSKAQDVVDRAGPPQSPPGFQIGLPGGGPTKEERARDRALHAEYRRRLDLLLARFDSARADSIARGMIKEPPPGAP